MKISQIREFIAKQSWIFAKTYADRAPHEYIVRGRAAGTDEEFMSVVNYIAENGITMYFWNHPNKYIYHKCANDILNSLQNHLPVLLKQEDYFKQVFYPTID